MREFVEVSHEMTLLLGAGPLAQTPLPPDFMALAFDIEGEVPTIALTLACDARSIAADARLQLVIQKSAFERVAGQTAEEGRYHLPSPLRAIALAIRDSSLNGETQKVYRLGKSIELLCETIRLLAADELVPLAGEGALSVDDTRRVVAARRMIEERWNEKLTLATIARACGLNRAKLTRGFREAFHCTVAEALAEQRLNQASHMLLTTDKPVSSIGYENGYLNNASFARAFARRFGVSPSYFRQAAA